MKTLLFSLLLALPVFALDDAPFQELKTYDFQNRKSVETINAFIRTADAATQSEIETKLLVVAQDPATTFAAQQEIGKMLWKVGSGRAVPVLSKWLSDEKLADVARYALERNADPAAGKALREALTTAKGKALTGVITSLGERRDAAALPALKNLAGDANAAISDAAISALGKIATPQSVAVLQAMPTKSLAVYQALLLSAAHMTTQKIPAAKTLYRQILDNKTAPEAARIGAVRGLLDNNSGDASPLVLELLRDENAALREAAARFVRVSQVPTRQLITEAEKLPSAGQILLLSALADRNSAALTPLLMRAAASPDVSVRMAALRAFAPLQAGTDAKTNSDVAMLLAKSIARNNAESAAAREGFYAMRGAAFDEAIVAAIPNAEPDVRRELVYALGQRYVESARPLLFKIATDDTSTSQDNALNALGEVATADDYATAVNLLLGIKNNRGLAENLVIRLSKMLPDEATRTNALVAALANSPLDTRVSIFKVLSSQGGGVALKALRSNTQNADAKIQDAAIRALAGTQDSGAMPDLLQLAQNAPTKAQQILSLRGYLRMAENAARENGAKPTEIYAPAIKIASETPERRTIIAGLSKINSPETLALIVPFLDDENTRAEAAGAVLNMVREFKNNNVKESRAALEKLGATVKDDNLLNQSKDLLGKLPAN